jgi:methionyl-tRNA synthetase
MKRQKTLTKRERKAITGTRPSGTPREAQHIHCVACGRHIDAAEFNQPASATRVLCEHKSQFASCLGCVSKTKELLAEHDRTGQPVKTAAAWH